MSEFAYTQQVDEGRAFQIQSYWIINRLRFQLIVQVLLSCAQKKDRILKTKETCKMAGYCDQGSNNWTMLLLTLLLSWPATVSASSAVSLASSSFLAPSEVNTCDISEFRCPSKDGQGTLCLPMDRWCNGKDECDNRVDEPRSCTSQYFHLFRIYS